MRQPIHTAPKGPLIERHGMQFGPTINLHNGNESRCGCWRDFVSGFDLQSGTKIEHAPRWSTYDGDRLNFIPTEWSELIDKT